MSESENISRLEMYCAQVVRLEIKLLFWLDVELRMREALADLAVEKHPCAPIYKFIDELFGRSDVDGSDVKDVIDALATSEFGVLRDFSRECREYVGVEGFAAAMQGARNRLENVVR